MADDGELVKTIPPECIGTSTPTPTPVASSSPATNLSAEDLNAKIKKLINTSPVMLFMKGTPEAPKCGFSAKIVNILNTNNVTFGAYNILEDEPVRNGLKVSFMIRYLCFCVYLSNPYH